MPRHSAPGNALDRQHLRDRSAPGILEKRDRRSRNRAAHSSTVPAGGPPRVRGEAPSAPAPDWAPASQNSTVSPEAETENIFSSLQIPLRTLLEVHVLWVRVEKRRGCELCLPEHPGALQAFPLANVPSTASPPGPVVT